MGGKNIPKSLWFWWIGLVLSIKKQSMWIKDPQERLSPEVMNKNSHPLAVSLLPPNEQ